MIYSNSQDALRIFIDSLSIGKKLVSICEDVLYDTRNNNFLKGLSPETKKMLKSTLNNIFDERFRKQDFITSWLKIK